MCLFKSVACPSLKFHSRAVEFISAYKLPLQLELKLQIKLSLFAPASQGELVPPSSRVSWPSEDLNLGYLESAPADQVLHHSLVEMKTCSSSFF